MTHAVGRRPVLQAPKDEVARRDRDRSLDGLRGVAAFVVLLFHSLLAVPALKAPNFGGYHASGWAWWVTNTPLRTLWAGTEAVLVFFLLSGFVLLPHASRQLIDWASYYGSRMVRLYLPVVGSLGVALLVGYIASRTIGSTTAHSLIRDAFLLRGVDYLNAPLWSLDWEVKFSLLLPLYVLFARQGRRVLALKVAALLVLVAIGVQTKHGSLTYLPIFALGMLLAVERDAVEIVVHRLARPAPRAFWGALLVGVALALDATWIAAARGAPSRLTITVTTVIEVVGAGLTLIAALYWATARTCLERPIAQWLGKRSFSLYLTHWPLVTLLAAKLGTRWDWLSVVIGIPAALLLAEVFYRLIERPSYNLSHLIGKRIKGLGAQRQLEPSN